MNRLLTIITIVVLGGALLVAGQRLERINPAGLSTPQTYSHVVKAGKLTFIAGQVGTDAGGKVAGSGMKEQTEQAWKNLQIALSSQG
ncbi:MAG: RidA family protein, partial [Vicinamibacterales bacterium]